MIANKYILNNRKIIILMKFLILINIPLISLFINLNVDEFRVNQFMLLKLFGISLFIFLILHILAIKEIKISTNNTITYAIIFFIILLTFSLTKIENIFIGLNDYISFIFYILIFFTIIYLNQYIKNIQYILFNILLFTASIVSIYTISQYYGFDPFLHDLNRMTSTLGQKNWISNYIAIVFPIAWAYFLIQKNKKIKIILYFSLNLYYINLIICQSRGIWISIGLTILIGIYLIKKIQINRILAKNKKSLIILLFTFFLITIIYSTNNPLNKSAITAPERAATVFNEKDPSINTRLLIWDTTIQMIKDNPYFGLGIGGFKKYYLKYQADILNKNPYYIKYAGKAAETHNEYLQIWAEMGIVGLISFLFIIFLIFRKIYYFIKNKYQPINEKLYSVSLLLGIICFLFHSLFTFPLHVPALGSTFFTLLAISLIYSNKSSNNQNLNKHTRFLSFSFIKYRNRLFDSIIIFIMILLTILLVHNIVIKPYIAEIYYMNGVQSFKSKKYIQALDDFKYSNKLYAYNGKTWNALGLTLYNLDLPKESINSLNIARKYTDDKNIYRNIGLSYLKIGNYQKAEKNFKEAIYLEPKFSEAYFNLGYLYYSNKKYNEAIESWQKISKYDPNFFEMPIIYYYIGMAYKKKQMPDKALEYFVQALQLVPEGSPIIEEIEKEIYNIYKDQLIK